MPRCRQVLVKNQVSDITQRSGRRTTMTVEMGASVIIAVTDAVSNPFAALMNSYCPIESIRIKASPEVSHVTLMFGGGTGARFIDTLASGMRCPVSS